MKRIILYVTLIIAFCLMGYIGMTNQPVELPNESILGVTYYKYNKENGEYDSIIFNKESIDYKGNEISLNGCGTYNYQQSTGIIKMDCGRAFRLIIPDENMIGVNIDGNNYYFYKNKEESFAREFQSAFDMTLSDYEYEGNEKLENIKINIERFNELKDGDIFSYVYVKNNVCSYECILLANSVTDLSGSKNVYYLDYNELTNEIISQIIEKDNEFTTSTSPKILVVGRSSINDIITISVEGLDTNKFIGYLDDYDTIKEVIENEEN